MSATRARLVRVKDLTDSSRDVTCEVSSLGPLLAGWWAELGISTACTGSHARALMHAVREADWPTVHRIADHVSLDVSAAGYGPIAGPAAVNDWWRP